MRTVYILLWLHPVTSFEIWGYFTEIKIFDMFLILNYFCDPFMLSRWVPLFLFVFWVCLFLIFEIFCHSPDAVPSS